MSAVFGRWTATRSCRRATPLARFFRLIAECRPTVVFGEQVGGSLGREWLAAVRLDLERVGYACGGADIPAASVGAPHIRQRLYWVADSEHSKRGAVGVDQEDGCYGEDDRRKEAYGVPRACGEVRGLADSERDTRDAGGLAIEPGKGVGTTEPRPSVESRRRCGAGGLADSDGRDASSEGIQRGREYGLEPQDGGTGSGMGDAAGREWGTREPGESARQSGTARGPGAWDDAVLIQCRDGKWRAAPDPESGILPLASGVPCRVGRLRAYGNAIVPQVAAEFVMAYMDTATGSAP